MSIVRLNLDGKGSVDIDLSFNIDDDIKEGNNIIKNSEKEFDKLEDNTISDSVETQYFDALNEYKETLEKYKDNPESFDGKTTPSIIDGLGEGEFVYDGYSLKIEYPITDIDILIQNIKDEQNLANELLEKFNEYDLTKEDKELLQKTFDFSNKTLSNLNKGKDVLIILEKGNHKKGLTTIVLMVLKSNDIQVSSSNSFVLFLNSMAELFTKTELGKKTSTLLGALGLADFIKGGAILTGDVASIASGIGILFAFAGMVDLLIEDPIGSLDNSSTKITFLHLAVPPIAAISLSNGKTIEISSTDLKTVLNKYIDIIDTSTVNMLYCLEKILEDRNTMIKNAVDKTYEMMVEYANDGDYYMIATACLLMGDWNTQMESSIFKPYEYKNEVDENMSYEEMMNIDPTYIITEENGCYVVHDYGSINRFNKFFR